MTTIWIGDFRIKQLQKMTKDLQQMAKYHFLTEDTSNVDWFTESAITQTKRMAAISANIVIALGFMDCVYSCLWESFDIDSIIEQYSIAITQLKIARPDFKVYFCSVNPIKADYTFAGSTVKYDILLNKINTFNTKIKQLPNITFIDSYTQLTTANFVTRDGIYYTSDTCNVLHSYIKGALDLDFSLNKEGLCTANSYNISIDDMKPNVRYIYQYLSDKGWTLNAIAALLGNMQVESKMSPWIWQGTIEGSIINDDETHTLNTTVLGDSEPGYGLVQWTPYTKYTNWCISNNLKYWDIDSQLQRICWEVENNEQWMVRAEKGYDITFKDFITSVEDTYWLAGAFAFCYERPGSSTGTEAEQENLKAERGNNAVFWLDYLSTFDFGADKQSSETDAIIKQPNLKVEKLFTSKLNTSASLFINK